MKRKQVITFLLMMISGTI